MKYILSLVAFTLLAACGGGGGGGGGGSPPVRLAPVAEIKSVMVQEKALDAAWSKVADEGGSFALAASAAVQYGAGSTFVSMTLSGTVQCNNATFGDPLVGTVKACYTQTAATPAPVPRADTPFAVEGEALAVPAGTVVRYGADTRWITMTVNGAGQCTNEFFGGDPAYGTVKACFAAAEPAPVLALVAASPTPDPAPMPPRPATSWTAQASSIRLPTVRCR